MRREWLPSLNHGPRPPGVGIDGVIVHATAGRSDLGDVAWCRKPRAEHDADYERAMAAYRAARARGLRQTQPFRYSPVSYHYIVGRDGTIYQLVAEFRRAWHAGKSRWLGRDNCNDFTIGVALSYHPSEGEYPAAQLDATATLVADILKRQKLDGSRMTGHADVSPGRKFDPFLSFPWGHFRVAVINVLYPPPEPFTVEPPATYTYAPQERYRLTP